MKIGTRVLNLGGPHFHMTPVPMGGGGGGGGGGASISFRRVSNRKYESMQNQSTAVFPSRSTIGKIETIPQMGMTLKMFAPNAILNQQC